MNTCFNDDYSRLVTGRSVGLAVPEATNGTPMRIPDYRRYRKASPGIHLCANILPSAYHTCRRFSFVLFPNSTFVWLSPHLGHFPSEVCSLTYLRELFIVSTQLTGKNFDLQPAML